MASEKLERPLPPLGDESEVSIESSPLLPSAMLAWADLNAAESADMPPAAWVAPDKAEAPADAAAEAAIVAAPMAAPAPKLPIPADCPPEPTRPANIGGSLFTMVSSTTDATRSTHKLFKSGVPS
ncbi:hypothetical protein D3C76_1267910 [compost metagenome]